MDDKYDTYREYCLDHKSERCEICGVQDKVVVHHLDGNRNNNSLDNLVPLCMSHHSRIHWGNEGFDEYVEQLPEASLFEVHTRTSLESTESTVPGSGEISYGFQRWDSVDEIRAAVDEGEIDLWFADDQ